MKRSPLRKMSKAKERETRKYLLARARRLNDQRYWYLLCRDCRILPDKFCEMPLEVPCVNHATEVHHSNGRAGKMLNDQRYWYLLCRDCHRWIHDNARAARALGLLPKSGNAYLQK